MAIPTDLVAGDEVRGDNTRLREVLRWEPSIRLEQGLAVTFE